LTVAEPHPQPRVPPLSADEQAALDPEVLRLSLPGPNGQPLNIFLTLARHPDLLRKWLPFGAQLLGRSSLTARDRELVILRVGWLCRAPYEWGQHAQIASAVGLTDDEIARVATGPSAPGWDAHEAALLRAADDLHHNAKLSDATWATLSERLDTTQLIELVFLAGQYHLVSFFLNTTGVEPETDDFPALPAGVLGPGAARLDYTILVVDDIDAALGFYVGALGLELAHRAGPYAQLVTGQGRLAFYERSAMDALVGPGERFEIGFLVDDVDRSYDAVVAAGAMPAVAPADRPWGQRTAYVRDPDGHLVELAQPR
jgi:4-carboxymuconolactone decarboxylase